MSRASVYLAMTVVGMKPMNQWSKINQKTKNKTNMWPYTDEENEFMSKVPAYDWYWERYRTKCLNEIAPLEDLTETEQPFRFAA